LASDLSVGGVCGCLLKRRPRLKQRNIDKYPQINVKKCRIKQDVYKLSDVAVPAEEISVTRVRKYLSVVIVQWIMVI